MPTTQAQLAQPDNWRSRPGDLPPNGAADTSEAISHPGTVHVGQSAVRPDVSTTHLAICEYRGIGTYKYQTIQTTIPAGALVMPMITLKGNAYGDRGVIDLAVVFYAYTGPAILNHAWVSTGTVAPAQVRLAHVGGFLAIELTWPSDGYYYGFSVDAVATAPEVNDLWFQDWTITSAQLVGPTQTVVCPRKYSGTSPIAAAQMVIDGVAHYSVTNELNWTGVLRFQGPGITLQDLPGGLANVNALPTGATVAVAGAAPRVVTAPGTGHNLGGLQLNRYETLWGFLRVNTDTITPADMVLQAHNQPSGVAAPPTDAGHGQWFLIAQGMEASVKLADGSVITQGGRIGRSSHMQIMNDFRQENGTQLIGYTFSPSQGAFGFTGTMYVGFGTGGLLTLGGGSYEYINPPAAGAVAIGFGAATSKTWRVMTAAERPYEFGEVYGAGGTYDLAPASVVVDLDDYDSLYWVPAITGSTNGYFAVRNYYDISVVPSHWFRIATRLPWISNSRLQLWNGRGLLARQCLWAGTQDQEARTARAFSHVTSNGQFSCRLTSIGAFAGTGVNGVDGTGETNGTYIGWPNNALMAGMNTSQLGETNFVWLHMPSAGTNIPILGRDASRQVLDIGGIRHVGLTGWQSLVYVPAPIAGATTAVDWGWMIIDYTTSRYVPMQAIVVAQVSAGGNVGPANGNNGTHLKMADGTYVHPGLYPPTSPGVRDDQGQGTGPDWRSITLAGQTPPGTGTSAVPAVASVAPGAQTPSFRVMASGSVSQPMLLLRGAVVINGYVPDNTIIGVIPGQQVASVQRVHVPAFHGTNFAVPATAVLELTNGAVGGASGIIMRAYGLSLANLSAQNGGPQAPGGFISLDGITLQRA